MRKLAAWSFLVITLGCQSHELPSPRTVSTNGNGVVEVMPDQARIHLSAKALKSTAGLAKQQVDDQVNALLTQLKQLGIDKKQVIASNIQLNPRYEHRPNVGPYFTGFEAMRNISVTLENLDNLTEVLDKALESGINTIQNVAYLSSEEQKHLAKARELAIADSREKASTLAKAYGAELGPIVTISYHNAMPLAKSAGDFDMPEVAMLRGASAAGVYLPDKLTFQDSIQVTFDLIIGQ